MTMAANKLLTEDSSAEEAGRPEFEAEEYRYKNVQWKDFFRKPKYIRASSSSNPPKEFASWN
jgi:hypothetical protein